MKNNNLISWDEYLNNELMDPCEAIAYLEVALEEYQTNGNTEHLMQAVKRVAEARGGISKLAQETNLSRQNLYKIFSNKTSPRFDTLSKILRVLGFTIVIKPFNSSFGICETT